jgi:hypothetical protein
MHQAVNLFQFETKRKAILTFFGKFEMFLFIFERGKMSGSHSNTQGAQYLMGENL